MQHEPFDTAGFYASPRGQVAAHMLRQRAAELWPNLAGCALLGVGYTAPLLSLWAGQAYRCLAAVPNWHAPPPDHRGVCAIEPDRLPFPDLSFDRIVLLHSVDDAGNADRLLRDVWRVLKDDGRILVIAPNRMGLWAHSDKVPFGQGTPYSQSQIKRLLNSAMFHVEQHDSALFVPPTHWRPLLRTARLWEKVGHALLPELAGVTLTEAVKDSYAAVPAVGTVRRKIVWPEAA